MRYAVLASRNEARTASAYYRATTSPTTTDYTLRTLDMLRAIQHSVLGERVIRLPRRFNRTIRALGPQGFYIALGQ